MNFNMHVVGQAIMLQLNELEDVLLWKCWALQRKDQKMAWQEMWEKRISGRIKGLFIQLKVVTLPWEIKKRWLGLFKLIKIYSHEGSGPSQWTNRGGVQSEWAKSENIPWKFFE